MNSSGGSLGVQQTTQSHPEGAPWMPPAALSEPLLTGQSFRQHWQTLFVSLDPVPQVENGDPPKMSTPPSGKPSERASAIPNRKLSAALWPISKKDSSDRALPADPKLDSRNADPPPAVLRRAKQPAVANISRVMPNHRNPVIQISNEKDRTRSSPAGNTAKSDAEAASIRSATSVAALHVMPSAGLPVAVPVCDSGTTKSVSSSSPSLAEKPHPRSSEPVPIFSGNPAPPVTSSPVSRQSVNSHSGDPVVSLSPSNYESRSSAADRSPSSSIPSAEIDVPGKTSSSRSIPAASTSTKPEIADAPQLQIRPGRESLTQPASSIHQQSAVPVAPISPHPTLREIAPLQTAKTAPANPARSVAVERRASRPNEPGSSSIATSHAQSPAVAAAPASTPVPGFSSSQEIASPSSQTQSPLREPFTAIDAGIAGTPSRWIHAGQHQAEAGFEDPSLGWVSVRAQADAHGVHASLIPNSADAAQVLDSHLASLNAHVAAEHPNLNPVTISSPQANWNGHSSGQALNQNDHPGTNNGNQQPEDQVPQKTHEPLPYLHSSVSSGAAIFSAPFDATRSPGGHQVWVVV